MTEQKSSCKKLVFIHIPKTAGTTLKAIIYRHYLPGHVYTFYEQGQHRQRMDRLVCALEKKKKIGLITGHIGWGIHRELKEQVRYLTVLREPVERVISMYNHIKRSEAHPNHCEVSRMSIEDYVRSGIDEAAQDSQTRFLSGVKWDYELAGKDDLIGTGDCTKQEMLDAAKQNLLKHIDVVGLSERFDETLILIRQVFGWRDTYYSNFNVGKAGVKKAKPVVKGYDIIAEHNALDIELYRFARESFDQRLASLPIDVGQEVSAFRSRNRIIGPLVSYPSRILQKLAER